jgi:penicillin amidase
MVLTFGPPAALAAVDRAETVLPPGESGFVRDAGTGAGSPHRFDQVDLFLAFQWKPALFGQPGTSEKPRPGVKIVRDKYGVPAVTAGNDADAWFGVGYAVAQDRLTEFELFRRRAYGTLAEVLGEGSLADDEAARRDLPGPAALDAEVARLPAKLLARARAYRDGVNRWIAHVRKNPADEPAEFELLGVPLRDWTLRDTAAVGALLVRNVPWASEGRELQNTVALRGIGAKNFDRLVPLHVKGAPLIIPRSEGRFPSQPGRTRADESAAFERSRKFVAGLKLPPSDPTSGPAARLGRIDVHGGSYAIAVRRGTGGVLYSGPQLGFSFPELLYEVEVNRPGLHVRGDTAPGAPVVAVGFNKKVAWGITSGESDTDDLYAERLVGGAESYRFRGKVRRMSCRNEVFKYSSGSTTKTHTARLCKTVHGPVQHRAGGWAYARRFATLGRELETVVGLDELDRAGSVKAVDRALGHVTWNENVTAVDSDGHLGFWHPGLLPLRPLRFDERLPYPGTGKAEWRGFLPVSKRPHVIDPKRNWLANWNNIPAAGWTSGDGAARGRLGGRLHRAAFLNGLVRKLAKHPSLGALEKLLHRSGTTAQQRPLVDGKLKDALQGSTGRARAVLRTLVAWDGSYARQNGAGTVSPGVAAWQEFKVQIQHVALDPMGPGALQVDGENAAYHFFDASNGVDFGLRTLGAAGYRKAAAATFAVLAMRFGTSDPAKWREPRHNYPWTIQGAGSPPPMPFFERGTYEQLVDVK